jgi:hypothetical protein
VSADLAAKLHDVSIAGGHAPNELD